MNKMEIILRISEYLKKKCVNGKIFLNWLHTFSLCHVSFHLHLKASLSDKTKSPSHIINVFIFTELLTKKCVLIYCNGNKY